MSSNDSNGNTFTGSWKSLVKHIPAIERKLHELFVEHSHSLTPREYAAKLFEFFAKELEGLGVTPEVLIQTLRGKLQSLGYHRQNNPLVKEVIGQIHENNKTEEQGLQELRQAGFYIGVDALRIYAKGYGTPLAPAVEIKRVSDDECLHIINKMLQDGPVYTQALSEKLHRPARNIVELYAELQRRGIPLIHDLSKQRAYLATNLPGDIPVAELDEEMEQWLEKMKNTPALNPVIRILLVSDIRFGSDSSQVSILHKIYKRAEEEQVVFGIAAGNILGGPVPKGHKEDFHAPTMMEQVAVAAKWWPKSYFKTHVVGGPRDAAWLTYKHKRSKQEGQSHLEGANPLKLLCEERKDLTYEGMFMSVFPVWDTEILTMARGDDNSPYAASYPLQGLVEMIANEYIKKEQPRVVIDGGWQTFVHLPSYMGMPGTDAIATPSLHRLNARQLRKKKRGRGPTIGAVILEIHFDVDGNGKFTRKKELDIVVRDIDLTEHKTKDDWRLRYAETPAAKKLGSEERRILELLDEKPMSVSGLGRDDKLVLAKSDIKKLIARLQALGFPLQEDPSSRKYFMESREVEKFPAVRLKGIFDKEVAVAATSDPHLYGIYENVPAYHRAYIEAITRKVKAMFTPGDIGQGWHYRGSEKDILITPQSDDAVDYIVQYHPRVPRKIQVDSSLDPNDPANNEPVFHVEAISGDHDYKTTCEKMGHDMIQYAALKMGPWFRYHGYASAVIAPKETSPLVVKLFHPMGGGGYARSYKAQGELYALLSRVESEIDDLLKSLRESDTKLDIIPNKIHAIFMGHLHIAFHMIYKGIHVFGVPSFQSKTDDYMERKSLEPDIGAWFPTFIFDKDNNVTECRAEYLDLRSQAASMRECRKRRHYNARQKYFEWLNKQLAPLITFNKS